MTIAGPVVPQTPAEADPRRWIALFTLLLASFMNLIDVTIVNVALPSMQENLGASSSQLEWIVAGYILAFALGLLPFGRLGDIIGRKRLFLAGVGAFTLASAACGLAPSIEWLIAARVLQGIGGAVMTPQVLAIVQVTFPPQEKGLAFSMFGVTAGLASVAGPITGGLLISADIFGLDWRPIFLVNVPLGLLTIVAGSILIPAGKRQPGLRNDWIGILLAGAAILALVFPLVEGRTLGWPLWLFALMIASGFGIAAFYLWERARERSGQPQLLPIQLLNNRRYLLGIASATVFFSAVPGLFMILALFLQSGFAFTPLQSGLATLPFPLGVLLASGINGRLGSRVLRGRMFTGAVMLLLGMATLRIVLAGIVDHVDPWHLSLPLLVSGVGLGITISALFQTVLSVVPPRDAGSGSGALQTFQQIGAALGVALIGEIFFASLQAARAAGAAPHPAFVSAVGNALWYQIGACLLLAAMVPFMRPQTRPQTRTERAPVEV
jgi:EmrB/QacA subfamily drug resistance transporter